MASAGMAPSSSYRDTSLEATFPLQDPTVALCLETYGDPGGWVFLMSELPLYTHRPVGVGHWGLECVGGFYPLEACSSVFSRQSRVVRPVHLPVHATELVSSELSLASSLSSGAAGVAAGK